MGLGSSSREPGSVGQYRLLQRLGEGGMGVVHLGLDPEGRAVAVKVLRPHIASDPDARRRLAREVATLRRVRHPRVAAVIDADVEGDVPFVVTHFVPGKPLDAHVRDHGPLPRGHVARVGSVLADALRAIHSVGVVHRDVKPANVMLLDGDPVLIDFGIAHVADESRITHTGLVMGTPGYLSPEIIGGDHVTEATDWWGWGATLAYAATGRPPFGTGPIEVVLDRVRRGVSDMDGIDDGLRRTLTAALTVDPTRRPHPDELIAGLAAASPKRPLKPVPGLPAPGPAGSVRDDTTERTPPPREAATTRTPPPLDSRTQRTGDGVRPLPAGSVGAAAVGAAAVGPAAVAAVAPAVAGAMAAMPARLSDPNAATSVTPAPDRVSDPAAVTSLTAAPDRASSPYAATTRTPHPSRASDPHAPTSVTAPPRRASDPHAPTSVTAPPRRASDPHAPTSVTAPPRRDSDPDARTTVTPPPGGFVWGGAHDATSVVPPPNSTRHFDGNGSGNGSAPGPANGFGRPGPRPTVNGPAHPSGNGHAPSVTAPHPDSELTDPKTPADPTRGVLAGLVVVLAAVAAVAPYGATWLAALGIVTARVVDRTRTSLLQRRDQRGPSSSDQFVTVAALPWRILVEGAKTWFFLILPILVGISIAFIVATAQAGAPARAIPGEPVPLAAGMFALLLTSWYGPGGSPVRRGTKRVIRRVVPGRRAQIITWSLVALVLISVLSVLGSGSAPDWGPLEQSRIVDTLTAG